MSVGIKEFRDFKMKTKHFLFSILLLLTLLLVSCDNSSNSKNLSLEEKLDKAVSSYVKKMELQTGNFSFCFQQG